MKKCGVVVSLALAAALLAPMAFAQKSSELNNPLPRHFPTQQRFVHEFAGGGGAGGNLNYHNGPVIPAAHVIPIYWGSNWTSGNDNSISISLTNFIGTTTGGFGQTGEYNVITQYYEVVNASRIFIAKSNLGSAGAPIYDSSNPVPTNVTDAALQAEVISVTGGAPASDTIYEVFLPASSYSSSGTATSCGGTNLQYCAYHGNFTYGSTDVKYASMPYPSCGGCQSSGFTTAQNFEHFVSHETREAVTDPDGTGWWDRRGYEADDKCAWSPAPFIDSTTGFAYQYEWSNANSACVKTR